jgi:hypothetical protein
MNFSTLRTSYALPTGLVDILLPILGIQSTITIGIPPIVIEFAVLLLIRMVRTINDGRTSFADRVRRILSTCIYTMTYTVKRFLAKKADMGGVSIHGIVLSGERSLLIQVIQGLHPRSTSGSESSEYRS